MNADIAENNKRIARNTVYMYFRMFITLIYPTKEGCL